MHTSTDKHFVYLILSSIYLQFICYSYYNSIYNIQTMYNIQNIWNFHDLTFFFFAYLLSISSSLLCWWLFLVSSLFDSPLLLSLIHIDLFNLSLYAYIYPSLSLSIYIYMCVCDRIDYSCLIQELSWVLKMFSGKTFITQSLWCHQWCHQWNHHCSQDLYKLEHLVPWYTT